VSPLAVDGCLLVCVDLPSTRYNWSAGAMVYWCTSGPIWRDG